MFILQVLLVMTILSHDLTLMSTGCNRFCAKINFVLCRVGRLPAEYPVEPKCCLFQSYNIVGAFIQFVDPRLLVAHSCCSRIIQHGQNSPMSRGSAEILENNLWREHKAVLIKPRLSVLDDIGLEQEGPCCDCSVLLESVVRH